MKAVHSCGLLETELSKRVLRGTETIFNPEKIRRASPLLLWASFSREFNIES